MATRNYGQGTIHERKPGVYTLRASVVDSVTGERRRISETFVGGKKDAARRLSELVTEHNAKGRSTDLTVADIVRDFRAVAHHADGTSRGYDNCWKHVPDKFRSARVRDVDVAAVDRLYAHLVRQGVSLHTVVKLHALLGAAFNQSIKWGRFTFNPVAHATCPQPPRTAMVLPESGSVARLAALVADDAEMRCWLRVLMATGGRRGETLGLRWSDVVGDSVVIRRQVTSDGKVVEFTKTREERHVAIDAATLAELARWKETKGCDGGGLVFSKDADGLVPHRGDTVYRRFKKLAAKAGIPEARPHTMRHLMVSLLLDAGQSLEVVSKRAGHSSAAFTARAYAHIVNRSDRRAADVIGDLLPPVA